GDLVRTSDGGASFALVDAGIHPVNWIQWVSASRAWAAGPDGVVTTRDGGLTWERQLALPADRVRVLGGETLIRGQVGFHDESNGFAEFQVLTPARAVIFHTSDGGAHWVAEGCSCGSAGVAVPDWLRQGAAGSMPDTSSELTVSGPEQAVVLAST